MDEKNTSGKAGGGGGTNALICGIDKTLNIAVNSLRIVFYYLGNATLKAF